MPTDTLVEPGAVAPTAAKIWRRIAGSPKTAFRVWLLQSIATVVATIAALVDIESIMVMGPISTILGLVMTLLARPLRSWIVLAFGISAPLTWSAAALWITIANLGPPSAQFPISMLLLVSTMLSAPLAACALWSISQRAHVPIKFIRQFSLKSLLILTTAVCLILVVIRLAVVVSNDEERILFGSFVVVVLALSSGATWYFLRQQNSLTKFEEPTPRLSPESARVAEALVAAGFFETAPDAVNASLRSMARQLNVSAQPAPPDDADESGTAPGPTSVGS